MGGNKIPEDDFPGFTEREHYIQFLSRPSLQFLVGETVRLENGNQKGPGLSALCMCPLLVDLKKLLAGCVVHVCKPITG